MTIDVANQRTPGALIRQRLAARGWSQRILAAVLDVGEPTVTRLVSGKQPIDARLALLLSEVLETPAEELLARQAECDLTQARKAARPDAARALRARLHGELPVAEMIGRGWLGGADMRDRAGVEAALLRFFGAGRLEEVLDPPDGGGATLVQHAWLCRVRRIAAAMPAAPFSQQGLRGAIGKLRTLTGARDAVAEVPGILAACGIRLAVVEALGEDLTAGAWLGGPAIALSLRDDRIDRFWCVLRQALEHVLCGDGRSTVLIAGEASCDTCEAAREFCVPQAALDAFLAAPYVCERDMVEFARSLGVHPGLVAGRMPQAKPDFDRFRAHRVPVRAILCRHAVTDGWGNLAFASPAQAARRVLRREPVSATVPA